MWATGLVVVKDGGFHDDKSGEVGKDNAIGGTNGATLIDYLGIESGWSCFDLLRDDFYFNHPNYTESLMNNGRETGFIACDLGQ